MAALQQTAIAFQWRSTPPPPSRDLSAKPLSLSFFSTFNPLKRPTLTAKLSTSEARRCSAGALGARMADSAAGSYATALAEVAKSNGTLKSTSSDMEKIANIFSDPQVYNFFSNPILDTEKKRVVLDEIVKSSSLQPHTANFLNILIDMKRLELINDIVKEFELVYNKMTDTEMALVTSVVKLESQHLAQIAKGVQRLTGANNVRIKTRIDPSLVAGYTIRYGKSGSKLIDMSAKKQLEEIAAQLDLGGPNSPSTPIGSIPDGSVCVGSISVICKLQPFFNCFPGSKLVSRDNLSARNFFGPWQSRDVDFDLLITFSMENLIMLLLLYLLILFTEY